MPEYTADCDGVGVLRMLDAIRASGHEKTVRFYQASTSELYGKVREVPQSETTPFYPRSPYAGTYPQVSHSIFGDLPCRRKLIPIIREFNSGQAICILDSCQLP